MRDPPSSVLHASHSLSFPQPPLFHVLSMELPSICLRLSCLCLLRDGVSDLCFLVTVSLHAGFMCLMDDIDNLMFHVELL